MNTNDLISALRLEIQGGLKEELMTELQPLIEKRLFNNIFSIKEATKYLGLSDSTLRLMVKENEVPYFRQRGQIFFRQSSLDQWITEQEMQNYKMA